MKRTKGVVLVEVPDDYLDIGSYWSELFWKNTIWMLVALTLYVVLVEMVFLRGSNLSIFGLTLLLFYSLPLLFVLEFILSGIAVLALKLAVHWNLQVTKIAVVVTLVMLLVQLLCLVPAFPLFASALEGNPASGILCRIIVMFVTVFIYHTFRVTTKTLSGFSYVNQL